MAPWSGTGTFNTAITFVPNTPATAEDQNTQDNDIAAGITNTLARDGQNAASANISLGGNKLVNVANGTGTTDGAAFGQLTTLLPPGIVLPTAGQAVPAGYLLCDGTAYSRTTYAALYAVISTLYGAGDGVTTFQVPNLIGRVIAGVDQTGSVLSTFTINTPGTPGGFGGTQGHTLAVSELTPHNHTLDDPGHAHSYVETGSGIGIQPGTGVGLFTGVTNTVGTGIAMENTGGGTAFPLLQPTMVMFYIIKT